MNTDTGCVSRSVAFGMRGQGLGSESQAADLRKQDVGPVGLEPTTKRLKVGSVCPGLLSLILFTPDLWLAHPAWGCPVGPRSEGWRSNRVAKSVGAEMVGRMAIWPSGHVREHPARALTQHLPTKGVRPMTDSTKCPRNTPWCVDHQIREHVEQCVDWLYTQRAPAAIDEAATTVSMYVSSSSSERGEYGPSVGLSVFGSIPWGVQPEEARKLAAALLHGADIVEASRTATCQTCERLVFPGQLIDRDECYRCEGERRSRLRAMMRGEKADR